MFIIYDLIFLLMAFIYLPFYLFKKKFHRGFLLRLGILPGGLELDKPIWIHAVSVGEAMMIRNLVQELRTAYPRKRFVISTVTPSGNKICQGIAKKDDFLTYLPLDLSFIIKSVLNRINPSIFIIAETELWPNLISYLRQKNIPVIVVNGRISDSSFKGYRTIKFLIRPILNKINLFCAQTERDAQRLRFLGAEEYKIKLTGNMKFDITDYADLKNPCLPAGRDYTDYKIKLGLLAEEKLFLAASTHSTEEEVILGVYKKLLAEFPDLRLLIAPRHPERSSDIENIIIRYEFNPLRVSRLTGYRVSELSWQMVRQAHHTSNHPERSRGTGKPANRQTIFILDTVGQLMNYYAIADIVFVGGSLVKNGGHNILEPLALGKPVLFGPYMFNFRDIADLFLGNGICFLVHNKIELEKRVSDLLNNPDKIDKMAKQAKILISQNQGATQRNLEQIKSYVAA